MTSSYGIGQEAEQELAGILGERGYTVIPISAFTNNTGKGIKAPMIVVGGEYSVSPDLLAMKDGRSFLFRRIFTNGIAGFMASIGPMPMTTGKRRNRPDTRFLFACWRTKVQLPQISTLNGMIGLPTNTRNRISRDQGNGCGSRWIERWNAGHISPETQR